jgi:hypothetical protein
MQHRFPLSGAAGFCPKKSAGLPALKNLLVSQVQDGQICLDWIKEKINWPVLIANKRIFFDRYENNVLLLRRKESSFPRLMRKFLLSNLFLIVSFSAFAQMNGNYNYSIALRAYTLKQMPKLLDESESKYFTEAILNGAMVKFNDNQIGYRLNGTFYKHDKKFFNNCVTCEEADGKLTDYSFTIGFEKNINYGRIQPYFGIDAGARINTFSGNISNRNELKTEAAKLNGTNIMALETSKVGLLVTPFIGVKVNPIPPVSLFVEGDLDYLYSYERQEITSYDVNNTKNFKKFNKSEFLLNPFSVGIQFHFSNNR